MTIGFAAQISNFIRKSDDRMRAVIQQSAQDVFNDAQTPQAAGGLMPVVTGFLRNTGVASINSIPSGPTDPSGGIPQYSPGNVTMALTGFEPGDVLIFGWTAAYAGIMDERYGFANAAAMKFPMFVERNASRLEGLLA